jgi:hypothetical protein
MTNGVLVDFAFQVKPLQLASADAPVKWWQPYYDQKNIKYRERLLFGG